MNRPCRWTCALASLALLSACRSETGIVGASPSPTILRTSVSTNVTNALSALVTVHAIGAESAAVEIERSAADPEMGGIATRAVRFAGDTDVVIPVLGLRPTTPYALRPVVFGAKERRRGEPLSFVTGPLPADLPTFVAGGPDPSSGYVVLAAGEYGVVIDNGGRIVWYRHFPGGAGLAFLPMANGRYATRPAPKTPTDQGAWIEVDALGVETRRLGCTSGMRPRLHDLIALPGGDYWLLCDDVRVVDLSAMGGVATAVVTGTAVQHRAADGTLLFSWSPFDHFDVTDLASSERNRPQVNWTHGNSIELDRDGNPIVSFRNLGEVTKLDVATGAVLWRLGGRRNEFAFRDAPVPPFAGQHSVRRDRTGELVLLDNVGDVTQSWARRYAVDVDARSARLVGSYGAAPGVATMIGGSVQALPGRRLLVSFGTAGRVEEYDESGRVVWRIDGNAGYVFRAQRIASLYDPAAPLDPSPDDND